MLWTLLQRKGSSMARQEGPSKCSRGAQVKLEEHSCVKDDLQASGVKQYVGFRHNLLTLQQQHPGAPQ
jgi:hypothetical protein